MRTSLTALLVLAAALVAVPSANAGPFSTARTYKVDITGDQSYGWKITDAESCDPQGKGSVRKKFTGRGITVKLSKNGRWKVSPSRLAVKGTTKAVDNTRPAPATTTPCQPIPKSGCGTARLKRSSRVELRGSRSGLAVIPRFGNVPMDGKCGFGGFKSFTNFLSAPEENAGGLPIVFSSESSLATKSSFTYTVRDRSNGTDGNLSATSVREVRLKFTRVTR